MKRLLLLPVVFVVLAAASLQSVSSAPGSGQFDAEVYAWSPSDEEHLIPNATIEIPALGINVRADAEGKASVRGLSFAATTMSPARFDVIVKAEGYGAYTYKNFPFFEGSRPIFTPHLRAEDLVNDWSDRPMPPGAAEETAPAVSDAGGTIASGTTCSGYTAENTPPASIRVLDNRPNVGDGLVHVVDLNKYVKHVLPVEIYTSWHQEALRANAMAVKTFSWYRVVHSKAGSGCYDLDANVAQQWDPDVEDGNTNAATDDTWDYYLTTSSGNQYFAEYRAGCNIYDGSCDHNEYCGQYYGGSPPGNRLSQWGSQACALQGQGWYVILLNTYYTNPSSQLKNGPHAVASTVENLPSLAPYTDPSSNTQVKVAWTAQSDVYYHICYDPNFIGTYANCNPLGTGVNQRLEGVPSGDLAIMHYRIVGCKNNYCSAIRSGGVIRRDLSGNKFYTTAAFIWTTGRARVAARNLTTSSHTMKLWDGVPGYGGGQVERTCTTAGGANCGPQTWIPNSPSPWYATGSQIVGSELFAPIRLKPQANGE